MGAGHSTQDTSWTLDRPLTGRAIPCEGGRIKILDCQNVELLSYLPPSAIGGQGSFDIWGWSDSATGREFVLIGGETGTAFVEVTDPINPQYLGILPLHGRPQLGIPGIKVYKNYAFIVAELVMNHGMQVFDLTQLRDVKTPTVFEETAHYDSLGNAHTLILNQEPASLIQSADSRRAIPVVAACE